MSSAFKWSKFWLGAAIWSSAATVAVSIAHTFGAFPFTIVTISLITLGFQAFAFFARFKSAGRFALGEKIRRIFMLKDGLGKAPSEHDLARIADEVGSIKPMASPNPYYESTEQIGPKRLIEHIRESAFFTERLAYRMFLFCLSGAIVGIGLSIFGFILMANVGQTSMSLEVSSKAFLTALGFWASGDLLGLALRYYKLFRSTEKILDRSEVAYASPSDPSALQLFSDYNCSVITAPPILQSVHLFFNSSLNKAWALRRG